MPITTVALSDAKFSIVAPTCENSVSVMSTPAAILTKMPRAPEKSISSKSGLRTAASAASKARLPPTAAPLPIIAMPISDITVRTSAKSTLIIPGRMIRSAMPCTAPNSTSSTAPKASKSGVSCPMIDSSFSFGTVINESTYSDSSAIPASAICMRLRPSNGKGLVTTATVKIPSSRAICATIGAAPVPVPPPIPAVMNTMSAPSSTS